eukprot:COSAG05_NODE_1129_length_5779_cov_11.914789_7_plen_496_part_00
MADWNCPKCAAVVFASKSLCFKCNTPNPDPSGKSSRNAQTSTSWGGGDAKALPSRLERSTAEYLRRLEIMIYNNQLGSEDEWESMLTTAFEEVKGQEYAVSGDVVGSRVIERLLGQAADHALPGLVVEHFLALLTIEQYWDVFGDKYGSHVAQTLFDLLRKLLTTGYEPKLSDEQREAAVQRIRELCADLQPKWLEVVEDIYASHVARALIKLLSGQPGDDKTNPAAAAAAAAAAASADAADAPTPHPELTPLVAQITDSLLESAGAAAPPKDLAAKLAGSGGDAETAGMMQLCRSSSSGPVLQLLLRVHPDAAVLAKKTLGWSRGSNGQGATEPPRSHPFRAAHMDPELARLLCRLPCVCVCVCACCSYLAAHGPSPPHVNGLLRDGAGSHLLETAITALSDEDYYSLYVGCFRGQLLELALASIANFVVQKLISAARQPAHIQLIAEELLSRSATANPHPSVISHTKSSRIVHVFEYFCFWLVCMAVLRGRTG